MKIEVEVNQVTYEKYQQIKSQLHCDDDSFFELLINNYLAMKSNKTYSNARYTCTQPVPSAIDLATKEVVRLFNT